MSIYEVQKALFHTNADPLRRDIYKSDPETFLSHYDLTDAERKAVREVDIATLYRMGVDPLLLRPFTILHGVSSRDHYAALRASE